MIELLTVTAAGALLVAVVGRMFADGWRITHRARATAESRQFAVLAMKRWQKEIRETGPGNWRVEGGAFRAGTWSARVEDHRLVLGRGKESVAMRLPDGAACGFAVEKSEGEADCAVLTLILPSASGTPDRMEVVRIVGCGRGEGRGIPDAQ